MDPASGIKLSIEEIERQVEDFLTLFNPDHFELYIERDMYNYLSTEYYYTVKPMEESAFFNKYLKELPTKLSQVISCKEPFLVLSGYRFSLFYLKEYSNCVRECIPTILNGFFEVMYQTSKTKHYDILVGKGYEILILLIEKYIEGYSSCILENIKNGMKKTNCETRFIFGLLLEYFIRITNKEFITKNQSKIELLIQSLLSDIYDVNRQLGAICYRGYCRRNNDRVYPFFDSLKPFEKENTKSKPLRVVFTLLIKRAKVLSYPLDNREVYNALIKIKNYLVYNDDINKRKFLGSGKVDFNSAIYQEGKPMDIVKWRREINKQDNNIMKIKLNETNKFHSSNTKDNGIQDVKPTIKKMKKMFGLKNGPLQNLTSSSNVLPLFDLTCLILPVINKEYVAESLKNLYRQVTSKTAIQDLKNVYILKRKYHFEHENIAPNEDCPLCQKYIIEGKEEQDFPNKIDNICYDHIVMISRDLGEWSKKEDEWAPFVQSLIWE